MHRAFGIQKHAATRAHQDVLGADVAVNQRDPPRRQRIGDGIEARRHLRHAFRRVAKERRDAERIKERRIAETACDDIVAHSLRMDAGKRPAQRAGKGRIDAARHQLVAPDGMLCRIEPVEDEQVIFGRMRDDHRHQRRIDPRDAAQPRHLILRPIYRRQPFGRDAQLRQRALYHERSPPRDVRAPHVAGDTAGQRRQRDGFPLDQDAQPAQCGQGRRVSHHAFRSIQAAIRSATASRSASESSK